MAETLGHRIRAARLGAGFKNAESLAVALKVGVRTVQRWEADDTEPSIARLIAIAALTKQPLSYFVTEEVAA